jgi:hypothetical protein
MLDSIPTRPNPILSTRRPSDGWDGRLETYESIFGERAAADLAARCARESSPTRSRSRR